MKYKFFSLLASTMMIGSCMAQIGVRISGTLVHVPSQAKVYFEKADSSGEYTVIDSTALSADHEFSFKYAAIAPDFFRISADTLKLDFMAETNDHVLIEPQSSTKAGYMISGTNSNKGADELKRITDRYSSRNDELENAIEDLAMKNKLTGEISKKFQDLVQLNKREYKNDIVNFTTSHENTLVGFLAIKELDPNEFESEIFAFSDKINGALLKNEQVKSFLSKVKWLKELAVGSKAPDFTLSTIEGKTITLSLLEGDYVMIDFWASWCIPCRKENPNIYNVNKKYSSKGLTVLGISLDKGKESWKKAIEDDHIDWLQVSDLKSFDGSIAKLYHIEAIPYNIILDRKGVIVAKNLKGKELDLFFGKVLN